MTVINPIIQPILRPIINPINGCIISFSVKILDLTSTALIEAWNTKYSGSYTRSSDMYVFDFEGVLQKSGTNVAPVYGGRGVTNRALWSQNISNAAWTKSSGVTITGTDGFTANSKFDALYQNDITTIEAHSYRLSFTVSVPSGQLTGYSFNHYNSETGNYTSLPTLTRTALRYSVKMLGRSGGGGVSFGFIDLNESNWANVIVTDFQVEDVTGQTNQNPSNHIPTTTAAVTKWYNTENANTVASNVVTEATGAALTNTIGMAFHPSTTNVIGSTVYRDFTHADWNVTDCSITAGDVVLIDGTTVADKNTLTASGANATMILDPYTSASGVHAGGIFVERKTGTGKIYITMDGGSTWVEVTSSISASAWFNAQTTLPTVTDPEFGIKLGTSGDAVYLDWAQMDDGYARVSAHPIIGGATLATQIFSIANAANVPVLLSDKEGSVYIEAQLLPDDILVSNSAFFVSLNVNGRYLYIEFADNSRARSRDGANVVTLTSAMSGYSKLASYWWDSTKQITSNGVSSAEGIYDGGWGSGILYGGSINGSGMWQGIISKVIFDRDPHDSTYWEEETK